MIGIKGGMKFMDELKYLKLCGFKRTKRVLDLGEGIVKTIDVVSIKKPVNSFYPKVSCVLGETIENSIGAGYSFILHYSPDEGYARHEVRFNLDEADEVRQKLGDSLFKFFSLTDSFLKSVRKSRLGGRKAWKIRHFPLPIKKAKVFEVFGLSVPKVISTTVSVNEDDADEAREIGGDSIAKRNMEIIVKKAAESYSLQMFDLYYEAWKEFYGKSGKGKAWDQFVKEVKAIQ